MSTSPDNPKIRYKSDAPSAVVRQHNEGPNPVAKKAQERWIPKPLQRVIGFFVLVLTVGLLSCQALVH